MATKKTNEEYIQELFVKNPNLELIGDYVNAKTKIPHRCKKHNIVWDISPDSALHGHGCEQCLKEKIGNKNRKLEENYIRELAIKNPTTKLCGKYIDNKTPVEHYCIIHGVFWNISSGNALQGCGCYLCGKERISNALKKTEEEYIAELSIKNPTIKLYGKYINADTQTEHYCEIHQIIFSTTPAHALYGCGCHKCHTDRLPQRQPKSEEQYIKELADVHPNIVLRGKYINSQTPTPHECLIHHFEWNPTPANVLSGKGCPKCSESRGEQQVTLWLQHNKMISIPQKRFSDCRDKYSLPFDFYLPNHNIAIEYQGEQHYHPVNFGGISDEEAMKNFNNVCYHDKIKSDYCVSHNIKLICIPYWENVDEYLNKNLLI